MNDSSSSGHPPVTVTDQLAVVRAKQVIEAVSLNAGSPITHEAIRADAERLLKEKPVNGSSPALRALADAQIAEAEAERQSKQKSRLRPLITKRLSEIEAEEVDWLWYPLIPRSSFTLLDGEEGIGKTFLVVCGIGGAVATGTGLQSFNDQFLQGQAANVLILSAEDSLSHVLKPRLDRSGIPTERFIAVDESFTLNPDGILRLSFAIEEHRPDLVVIDPLFSYTGGINLNNDNEIRSVTDAIKRLAETFCCAIVGIRHVGKSLGFGDVRRAGLNGVAWRASARSALLVGKNPDRPNERALCQTKNNYAPVFDRSLGYEIRDDRFYWTGFSDLTAGKMLSSLQPESMTKGQSAADFLKLVLKDGPIQESKVKEFWQAAGFKEATIRRAKKELGIDSMRQGFGSPWYWKLPKEDEDDQTK